MSEPKHTPGPWKVFITELPYTLNGHDGKHIERRIGTTEDHPQLHAPYPIVTLASGIGPHLFIKINEADANLIAAAPDLLQALQFAKLWINPAGGNSEEVASAVCAKINAAIAKAQGETK